MESYVIDIRDLSVVRNEKIILENFSFKLKRGEFLYITGKVGSGKSSLMKVMYADVPVNSGEVYVLAYNLNKIKKKEIPFLRRKLGIVFQNYQLLNDRNVYENLKFVLEAHGITNKNVISNKINDALMKVDLIDKINSMPYELSGGEAQQASVARAVINDPELIIADEPTGNLDIKSAEKIMTILHKFAESGTSVIMATHDLSLVEKFPEEVMDIST